MRYFYKPKKYSEESHDYIIRLCDHRVFNSYTLYLYDRFGLGVIEQFYDPDTKATIWAAIEHDLAQDIYNHPGFKELLVKWSGPEVDGYFPVVPLRKIMWALRMKPLKKEIWETTFDRLYI